LISIPHPLQWWRHPHGESSDAVSSFHVEQESAVNMNRTWVIYGIERDWRNQEQGEGHAFLHESIQVKNIWVPTGE